MHTRVRLIDKRDESYFFDGEASTVHCRDGSVIWVMIYQDTLVVTVHAPVTISRGFVDSNAIWVKARR